MRFKQSKFKRIIDYKSGYTWTKEQELSFPSNDSVRVLTVSNIQDKLDLSNELYLVNVSIRDKISKAVGKDWSIAVSSNGNRKRIGNAVFIDNDLDYLFASFLTAFKPKENSGLLPKYFFYWLSSYNIQERITSVSEGTTGLGNLDIRHLRNMTVGYPENTSEQRAIINILQKVDEVIRNTETSLYAFSRTSKALLVDLLSGKLKPDWSYRQEDEFVVDEKLGKVPMEWSVGKFKQLAVLQRGKDLTDDEVIPGIYPVVKSNGVQIYHNAYFVKAPGVVTGRSGTIGKVFYIETDFWAHNTSLYIKDFMGNCPKFIYYLIKRMRFEQHHAGTTVPTLNRNDIHKVRVTYPCPEEQGKIVSILDMFEVTIRDKTFKLIELRRLKQSLMQNLLTGKLQLSNEQISFINQTRV